MQDPANFLAHRGIALASGLLRRLDEVGIFAQPTVSLEHTFGGTVCRARIESGGAVKESAVRYLCWAGG